MIDAEVASGLDAAFKTIGSMARRSSRICWAITELVPSWIGGGQVGWMAGGGLVVVGVVA